MLSLEQIQGFFPEPARQFKRNVLREYLQYKILAAIFRLPQAGQLCFMGGTCIHIAHGCPRFSEDLDFDNRGISATIFQDMVGRIAKDLEREGYTLETGTRIGRACTASLRFTNVLQSAGITGHREERLNIKIDMEPQDFAYEMEKFILNKFEVFSAINTMPASILLAQKFHCILERKRAMGRDFYDATFLMGKVAASAAYLREKLRILSGEDLKNRLLNRCKELSLPALAKDVEPFLLSANDTQRILLFPNLIESRKGDDLLR